MVTVTLGTPYAVADGCYYIAVWEPGAATHLCYGALVGVQPV